MRFKLFDKRLAVYSSFKKLFRKSVLEVLTQLDFSTFNLESAYCLFLFGKEIEDYKEEVMKNGLKFTQLQRRLSNQGTTLEDRTKWAEELETIEKWFFEQNTILVEKFKKYLHFSINKNL